MAGCSDSLAQLSAPRRVSSLGSDAPKLSELRGNQPAQTVEMEGGRQVRQPPQGAPKPTLNPVRSSLPPTGPATCLGFSTPSSSR